MSRLTDEELRAALRLRAVGKPSPALRQRIRQSTRPAQQPRARAIHGVAPRRLIFARLTAIAAVAAVLILAPVVGAALDGQRLRLFPDSRSFNQTPAGVNVTAIEDGENDGDDDDEGDVEGDDEDGIDEDDEGDDEDGIDEDDEGDDEDGFDEDDQGEHDDLSDDDGGDPEESEDDD